MTRPAGSLNFETCRQSGFTRREREIYSRIVYGATGREIAQELCINLRTVQQHVRSILRKRGARTRVELVRMHWGRP